VFEKVMVSERKLRSNIDLFKKYYKNEEVLEYYLLVSQKKLE